MAQKFLLFISQKISYVPWILSALVLMTVLFAVKLTLDPLTSYVKKREYTQINLSKIALDTEINSLKEKLSVLIFSTAEDSKVINVAKEVKEGRGIRNFRKLLNNIAVFLKADFFEFLDTEANVLTSHPYHADRLGNNYKDWTIFKNTKLEDQNITPTFINDNLFLIASRHVFFEGTSLGVLMIGFKIDKIFIDKLSKNLTVDLALFSNNKLLYTTSKQLEHIDNLKNNLRFASTETYLTSNNKEHIAKFIVAKDLTSFNKSLQEVIFGVLKYILPLLILSLLLVLIIAKILATISKRLSKTLDDLKISYTELKNSEKEVRRQMENAIIINKILTTSSQIHSINKFIETFHELTKNLFNQSNFTLKPNVKSSELTDYTWKHEIKIGENESLFGTLVYKSVNNEINNKDITLLNMLHSIAELSLNNIYFFEDSIKQAHIKSEIELTKAIGSTIMPHSYPFSEIEDFTSFGSFSVATTLGGDWLGCFYNEEYHFLRVYIGDVTGHGIPSALVATSVMAYVHALEAELSLKGLNASANFEISFSSALNRLNKIVHKIGAPKFNMTLQIIQLNTLTGEAKMANAGHNHPFVCDIVESNITKKLIKPSGFMTINSIKPYCKSLPARGNKLGTTLDDDFYFDLIEFTLKPNQILVAYSDGIIEAINEEDKEYSLLRLKSQVLLYSAENVEKIINGVRIDVEKFMGNTNKTDDHTIFALKTGENFSKQVKF